MVISNKIRHKIKSIDNTKKITKAMEMIAASKMRKTQNKMYAIRRYNDNIQNITANLLFSNPKYLHPFISQIHNVKKTGFIIITTDKGLCGNMNNNCLRLAINKMHELEKQGNIIECIAIGNKSLNFLNKIGVKVVANIIQFGDTLYLEKLINTIKILLDAYQEKKFNGIYLVYTKFINTMKQTSTLQKILPLSDKDLYKNNNICFKNYIYEPNTQSIIDTILIRYIESLIHQAVIENIASEQSARIIAMKTASDNAASVISELKLIYNKARQTIITNELSEIIAGSTAI